MMQCTWCIYSRFPWHDSHISLTIFNEKHKIMDVPIIHIRNNINHLAWSDPPSTRLEHILSAKPRISDSRLAACAGEVSTTLANRIRVQRFTVRPLGPGNDLFDLVVGEQRSGVLGNGVTGITTDLVD